MTQELEEAKGWLAFYSEMNKSFPHFKEALTNANKRYSEMLIAAKRIYDDRRLNNLTTRKKTMWGIINDILGKFLKLVERDVRLSPQ